ncbi:MAG: glycosyltransferase family 2 protein [Patescibacteria group bacterium]|nr:glycosyltransferase family 2 protein [Patescibacteria group bacterium]
MPRVALSLVTWNSMKYLPDAMESVRAQSYPDLTPIIVDNGSSDGSAEFVRKEYPEAMVLQNTRNLGFARAHNQAIEYARTHMMSDDDEVFVMVTNPDIILDERFVERLVERFEHRTDAGSACGKLLKVYETMDGDLRGKDFSDTIDTAGLRVFRSRRMVERGSGEKDGERFERTEEVFGVSGAVAMYRMKALVDAAVSSEYFDEDFLAYKEDVDLSWRLRLLGWKSIFVPAARAYHYRALSGVEKFSIRKMMRGHAGRSLFRSRLSYRNHLLTIIKNDHLLNLLRDLPRIAFFEIGKFCYLTLFNPATLTAVPAFVRALPGAIRKRRIIMDKARAGRKDIRSWFV